MDFTQRRLLKLRVESLEPPNRGFIAVPHVPQQALGTFSEVGYRHWGFRQSVFIACGPLLTGNCSCLGVGLSPLGGPSRRTLTPVSFSTNSPSDATYSTVHNTKSSSRCRTAQRARRVATTASKTALPRPCFAVKANGTSAQGES